MGYTHIIVIINKTFMVSEEENFARKILPILG